MCPSVVGSVPWWRRADVSGERHDDVGESLRRVPERDGAVVAVAAVVATMLPSWSRKLWVTTMTLWWGWSMATWRAQLMTGVRGHKLDAEHEPVRAAGLEGSPAVVGLAGLVHALEAEARRRVVGVPGRGVAELACVSAPGQALPPGHTALVSWLPGVRIHGMPAVVSGVSHPLMFVVLDVIGGVPVLHVAAVSTHRRLSADRLACSQATRLGMRWSRCPPRSACRASTANENARRWPRRSGTGRWRCVGSWRLGAAARVCRAVVK